LWCIQVMTLCFNRKEIGYMCKWTLSNSLFLIVKVQVKKIWQNEQNWIKWWKSKMVFIIWIF
jgi:hypothetical protein